MNAIMFWVMLCMMAGLMIAYTAIMIIIGWKSPDAFTPMGGKIPIPSWKDEKIVDAQEKKITIYENRFIKNLRQPKNTHI